MLDRIVADLQRVYGAKLQAAALYGSLARDEDGDFSDVELWCMVDEPGLDQRAEWVIGPGKAEVDLMGPDVVWASARAVEDDWCLAQGAFVHNRPLVGDPALFEELRAAVYAAPQADFDRVITAMVVGECFEWMGKLRNGMMRAAGGSGDLSFLPGLACDYTAFVARMAGLLHRHIYRKGIALVRESLALPTLPEGYVPLAQRVMAGTLDRPQEVAAALEACWAGLGPWLAAEQVDFAHATHWPWPANRTL
jgi:kanamycin nucleotidyltransferase